VSPTYRLRSNAIEWREVEGEIVALDLATQNYLAVNPAGATIWKLLADGANREHLVEGLQERFDVDEARAGDDVDAYLEELRQLDLLERHDLP
jgi:hypothetical protein